MLDATVAAWLTAITARKRWQPADEARLTEGFHALMTTARQWPAPAQYLEAIPPHAAMPRYRATQLTPSLPSAQAPALLTLTPSNESTAAQHIARLAELLQVDLSQSREQAARDYRERPERPFGVDLADWPA
jgi:hypothetical protein